jgi:hypothetical protein
MLYILLLQNVISFTGILSEHVLIRAGIVIRGWIEFRQVSLGLGLMYIIFMLTIVRVQLPLEHIDKI